MQRITSPPPLPIRPKDGHKGMFGRVLIVGGSEGMMGAPTMAGRSALKLGAGLVQIAVPKSILSAALMVTPELIGIGLGTKSDRKVLTEAAEKADAIVVGPGLGQSASALANLKLLVGEKVPVLVDADGLNLLAAQKKWPKFFKASGVLTPHPGEMKRLAKLIGRDEVPTDDDGRIQIAIEAAKAFDQVILLKGSRTVVTDGTRVYVNNTGDSSLSKAGTGDCLSGMCGTLLAQKMPPFEAASAAAWLHGKAGEIAGTRFGLRSVLAHDVIESLSSAISEYIDRYGEM